MNNQIFIGRPCTGKTTKLLSLKSSLEKEGKKVFWGVFHTSFKEGFKVENLKSFDFVIIDEATRSKQIKSFVRSLSENSIPFAIGYCSSQNIFNRMNLKNTEINVLDSTIA
jgi:nucleoside-triphosphatase THEP1